MNKTIIGALLIGLALGFAIGYSTGYLQGIEHAVDIGLRFVDFEVKPDAKALIMSYLQGGT